MVKITVLLLKQKIMTDPFFTTWNNNPWNNQWNQSNAQSTAADNTQNSIDKIMAQQEQIQWKYKELKELLQNPELTDNQKDEIHDQMQRLSDLYSQNKSTLATLTTSISWEKEIHVDKNVNTENSKSKNFSFKKFMIWCGILLILFLWWLVAVFYSLMKDQNRLNIFWVDRCTAVNLLQLFSIIFFWLLFILWLWLFLVNLNKTITSKNKRKAPFILWVLLSFFMMIFVAFFLVKMLNTLSWFSETCQDPLNTQVVNATAIVKNTKFKDSSISLRNNPSLVAPINVSFTLNDVVYKDVATKLWSVSIKSIVIDCWNWQTIQLWNNSSNFSDTCFYTQKWSYSPEFLIYYTDAVWTPQTQKLPVQNINIGSEVSVASENYEIQKLNSALVVWKNPVNLKFDSASVFKDYNLLYDIKRSAECNWMWDDEKSVLFQSRYTNEWVYDVCVYFPELSEDIIYTFPIRVEQWEVIDGFDVKYTVSLNTSNNSFDNPEQIQITQLPTQLTLQILSITPNNSSVQKRLFKDWESKPSLFSDPNTFQITIDEEWDQELTLELTDPDQQISTTKTIKIVVNQATIIGSLLVSPETVWTSPFTVNLDASTTTLNDPNDEIVFFSRDFGDWIKNSNTSEAIISHTYEYDFVNDNWVFYPSVVMRTKNWLTFTVSWTIISVKKPNTNISISLDEHPAQLANVWENVPMSISFDWMPKKIYWEFWDWDTQECDWRSCSETMHPYVKWWTYSIKARVEFDDKPALEWYINLQIR